LIANLDSERNPEAQTPPDKRDQSTGKTKHLSLKYKTGFLNRETSRPKREWIEVKHVHQISRSTENDQNAKMIDKVNSELTRQPLNHPVNPNPYSKPPPDKSAIKMSEEI